MEVSCYAAHLTDAASEQNGIGIFDLDVGHVWADENLRTPFELDEIRRRLPQPISSTVSLGLR